MDFVKIHFLQNPYLSMRLSILSKINKIRSYRCDELICFFLFWRNSPRKFDVQWVHWLYKLKKYFDTRNLSLSNFTKVIEGNWRQLMQNLAPSDGTENGINKMICVTQTRKCRIRYYSFLHLVIIFTTWSLLWVRY